MEQAQTLRRLHLFPLTSETYPHLVHIHILKKKSRGGFIPFIKKLSITSLEQPPLGLPGLNIQACTLSFSKLLLFNKTYKAQTLCVYS